MFTLKDYNIQRYSFTLSNGVPVVFFHKPSSPLYMKTSFIAGSRFDPIVKKGLAHYTEHLILAGTKIFPSKDLLAGFMEDLGGSIGASTGSDLINIGISLGDSNDLIHGVTTLNEILNNSLFNEKTIETERKAILRELESKKASPTKSLGEISKSLLYQDTVLELPTLGSIETINNINREDLLNYYQINFNSGKCGITICGDVDQIKIKEILENYLKIKSGNKLELNTKLPIIRNKFKAFKYYDNNNLALDFSFRTPKILDDDVKPLGFLAAILTGGRTGSLKKILRYERGLVYSIGSGTISRYDSGDFGISCGISKDTIQEVLDIICSEISRISTQGPTPDELILSKNRSIKSVRIPMQTVSSWVDSHIYKNIFFPHLNWTIEDDLALSDKITVEDIKRVSAKYLNKDNWYLSLSGPADEELLRSIKITL